MTPDEWDAWIEEAIGQRNVERFERHLIFWLDAQPLSCYSRVVRRPTPAPQVSESAD